MKVSFQTLITHLYTGHEEKHHFQISYGLKSYPVRRINAAVL